MDELLNKLIEVDKSARKRVSKAKKEKSQALTALESKKEELKKEGEEKFKKAIDLERERQKTVLENAAEQIDENRRSTIAALNSLYEKKGDEWVASIVADVIK